MGWANCGTDSKGRPIGYAHDATCDHPGCDAKIHRGLSYACGDMHGEDEISCEGYFCEEHRVVVSVNGETHTVCLACEKLLHDEGMLDEEPDEEEASGQ